MVRHLEPEIPVGVTSTSDVDRGLRPLLDGDAQSLRNAVINRGLFRFDVGYTSPYLRCRQTAEVIQGTVHNELWFESPELRESAHPGQEVFLRNKALVTPESMFDLRDRVARFLDTISHGESIMRNVLVVTHGDVINAFRWCLEGLTLEEFRGLFQSSENMVKFGSVWQFDLDRRRLMRVNLGQKEPELLGQLPGSLCFPMSLHRARTSLPRVGRQLSTEAG